MIEKRKLDITVEDDIFLDCYLHLVHEDDGQIFDIDFIYGGRDSGKSRHVAMQLVKECMKPGYFKYLLIRKVLNTVRSSQFDLIKSIIEEWHNEFKKIRPDYDFQSEWSINESRLEIIWNRTGNGFYGRGLDDVGRIKSFNNPSGCWIEEGNQISNEDFVVILTSLRSNDARVKTWFTFNPECDVTYTEFWLWQEYFAHTTDLSWTHCKVIDTPDGPVELNIRATHSTYRDNPYCSPTRKALYESYRTSKNNAYWYQTYTLGLWGYRKTGAEFWKCFDPGSHVSRIEYTNVKPVHVVVDNNVNPYISVQIWQTDVTEKLIKQIHELPCVHPENTAKKAAQRTARYLRSINYTDLVYIYGDPSANAKSTNDDEGKSFFDKFIAALIEEGFKISKRVQRSAPGVALSGAFINEIYETNLYGWRISIDDRCRKSIEDYTLAKEDVDGRILKKKEKDEQTEISYERYGHFSDCKRYFITTILGAEFVKYKSRNKKGSVAAERE
jgi:hypothetical protein